MSMVYDIHFTGVTAMSFLGNGTLKIINDAIKLSGRQLKYPSLLYRIVYNISLLAMFVVFFGFSFFLVSGLMVIGGVFTPTYIPTKHGPIGLIVAFMLLYPVIVLTSRLSKFFFIKLGEASISASQILSIYTHGSQDDEEGVGWIDVNYRDKSKRHKLSFSCKPSVSKGIVASIMRLTLKKAQSKVSDLIASLQHKDCSIRERAAWALGEINDPRVVEPLIAVLKTETCRPYPQRAASKALRNLTGKDFGVEHKKWLKWWEENKDKFLKSR